MARGRGSRNKPRVLFATSEGVYFVECDYCSLGSCIVGVTSTQEAKEALVTRYHWTMDNDGCLLCPECSVGESANE